MYQGNLWSAAEEGKLRKFIRDGLDLESIVKAFPERSAGGVKRKYSRVLSLIASKAAPSSGSALPAAESFKGADAGKTPQVTAPSMAPAALAPSSASTSCSASVANHKAQATHTYQAELDALSRNGIVQCRKLGSRSKVWNEVQSDAKAMAALVRGDSATYEFRVGPCVISVNGKEVPAPQASALRYGQEYFVPSVSGENLYLAKKWMNSSFDSLALSRGLVHLVAQAAVIHASAMLDRA